MGAKTPNPTDRRVLRTRRALREALVTLILEKGFEAVSIQDVADRADVGRSTFYTHFADKEDLLLSGSDDLRAALRQAAARDGRPLAFTRGIIDHAGENRRLFRAIVGRRTGAVVLRMFHELVSGLAREDLAGGPRASVQVEATVQLLAGAFVALLAWWLESRSPLSAEELDALFHRSARSAIDPGRRAKR